jgi:hypothetical protein
MPSLPWSRTSRGLALVEPKPCSSWSSVCTHACPAHTYVPVHMHSHARNYADAANPNASAHVCSPKPSDARSNHLGRPDPHHLPALAWSPLSFLCAVTVARRRSRIVAMVTPPPYRPTAVAWTPVCARVLPCLVQPRAHARARAQPRNHACACLERSRPSPWLPFAPDLVGTSSRHGTRLCRRGKSFLPGSASANSIPFLRTCSSARTRQPDRHLPHLE